MSRESEKLLWWKAWHSVSRTGSIPANLRNKRIIAMDLVGMLSGARFRGDFEERMKSFLEEAEADGDVILFI